MVRSSLALALVTGRSVEIKNIRAKRKKPGLMEQHLTAVRAAAEVGQAEIEGDSYWLLDAAADFGRAVVSRRQLYIQGRHRWQAATLVFQTVCCRALLSAAQRESHLVFEGGTHNSMAPPFDFLAKAFVPLVNRMGPTVTHTAVFAPDSILACGGRFAAIVRPTPLGRLELDRKRSLAQLPFVRALVANLAAEHRTTRVRYDVARATGWELHSMSGRG